MIHTLRSITGHGINGNIVDAAEDAVFDIGIVALQAAMQYMGRIRVMPGKLVLWSLGGMACIWEP